MPEIGRREMDRAAEYHLEHMQNPTILCHALSIDTNEVHRAKSAMTDIRLADINRVRKERGGKEGTAFAYGAGFTDAFFLGVKAALMAKSDNPKAVLTIINLTVQALTVAEAMGADVDDLVRSFEASLEVEDEAEAEELEVNDGEPEAPAERDGFVCPGCGKLVHYAEGVTHEMADAAKRQATEELREQMGVGEAAVLTAIALCTDCMRRVASLNRLH